jgi:hypothetical protein
MSVVATHRYTCLCGEKSPRFTSRKSARDWHASHVQAGGPVRRAKPRHELNCEDFDQLTAHARKFRPIEPSMYGSAFVVSGEPKRADVDHWGRSLGGGVRWTGTNCLRASIANLLGAANLDRVPDPTPLFTSSEDWLSDYSDQLAEQTGYRLEEEAAHVCLDIRNAGRRWIAVIEEPEKSANHAIVDRGNLVYHDPAQRYGALPRDRVLFGLVLVPRGARSWIAGPQGRVILA